MHDARCIANDLIRKSADFEKGFTPLQLQMLIYFAHAWTLAIHGKPLIAQNFIAWPMGPVAPDLYHSLRRHGAQPVASAIPGYGYADLDPDEERISLRTWEKYGSLPGARLLAMTAVRGSPWYQTRYGPKAGLWTTIPDTLIRDYHQRALDAIALRATPNLALGAKQ